MIDTQELRDYLNHLSKEYTGKVFPKLTEGDVIRRGYNQFYKIDNLDLDKGVSDIVDNVTAYKKIHGYLKGSVNDVTNLFGNSIDSKSIIPFSKAVEKRTGVCLEKALLGQMNFRRRGERSFMIDGILTVGEICEKHAFNVVFENKGAYLYDIENASRNPSTGKKIPYIVPIEDVDGDHRDFIVPKEWKHDRTYSIF